MKLPRQTIMLCEMQAATSVKFALSILEFLVMKEECAKITVYGSPKGREPMNKNKRMALRSKYKLIKQQPCFIVTPSFCQNWL